MPSRYLGQDTYTPTYMEALSGRNIAHARCSKDQKDDSAAVI